MKTARIFLILAGVGVSACSNNYYERKDGLTFSNGDSVEANKALQIADPWPKGSQNTNIPMDPVKAAQAIYRYRCGGGTPMGKVGFGSAMGAETPGGTAASPEASGGYC
jgi:hypothetical protein